MTLENELLYWLVPRGTLYYYTVEPPYKGQVRGWVLCSLHSGASLQGTNWGYGPVEPLYKGQVVLCSLHSRASLQGTSWGYGPVEPLYKGQVVLCSLHSRASLQGTSWGWVPLERGCPLLGGDKCTIPIGSGILCSKVVLFSEGPLSEVSLYLVCVCVKIPTCVRASSLPRTY